ncbi:hypothetical protein AX774_g2078 [Zancudomyces culisetae]|uniref:Uncharacterized protein n=1 Tax=Zancudomyces culisetae TaxID=1213189 RepID=A0A1R1PTY0_ZANCU|nr:hypothetical protein AX774_g2078 [Zancudomyces culisetae]|eukprot:OMH84404.1 hypothetical protein AX774_g2078 [Zancudomyces culisetae]
MDRDRLGYSSELEEEDYEETIGGSSTEYSGKNASRTNKDRNKSVFAFFATSGSSKKAPEHTDPEQPRSVFADETSNETLKSKLLRFFKDPLRKFRQHSGSNETKAKKLIIRLALFPLVPLITQLPHRIDSFSQGIRYSFAENPGEPKTQVKPIDVIVHVLLGLQGPLNLVIFLMNPTVIASLILLVRSFRNIDLGSKRKAVVESMRSDYKLGVYKSTSAETEEKRHKKTHKAYQMQDPGAKNIKKPGELEKLGVVSDSSLEKNIHNSIKREKSESPEMVVMWTIGNESEGEKEEQEDEGKGSERSESERRRHESDNNRDTDKSDSQDKLGANISIPQTGEEREGTGLGIQGASEVDIRPPSIEKSNSDIVTLELQRLEAEGSGKQEEQAGLTEVSEIPPPLWATQWDS